MLVITTVLLLGLWWLSADESPRAPSITQRVEQIAAPPDDLLSTRVISAEDLPPDGTRSLFDHLLAQNDGLPYPFERLVEMLQRYAPEGAQPLSVMIPLGRSLLKGQADFHRPRILTAPDFQVPASDAMLAPMLRSRLFLGFVEDAAEIEVISYNEAAGRYEFQLVQDYREGGVPRIVYARRAICQTCHQGAVPIFPERPWSETSGQPEISARIVQARGDAPYHGLPVVNALATPERYDDLTDVAAFVAVTQRVWLDGCGEGAAGARCRRHMLRLALRWLWNPGEFDEHGASAGRLRQMQARAWPEQGIAVPDNDIRNRDPLVERGGWRGLLRTVFQRGADAPGARSNEDLVAFERLPPLPAEQDPLTPRPTRRVLHAHDLDGVYGIAQLFTRDDFARLDRAAGFDPVRLGAAVDALDDALFEPAPLSRVRLMQALLVALEQPVPGYCCLDTADMSPPVAAGVPPLDLAADSMLKAYEQYCFACHRGNPAARLSFMDGEDESEVLARIRATPEIRDTLDWARYRGTAREGQLMPPADSAQYRELQAALDRGEPVLEEMRKVVPGLFDF